MGDPFLEVRPLAEAELPEGHLLEGLNGVLGAVDPVHGRDHSPPAARSASAGGESTVSSPSLGRC